MRKKFLFCLFLFSMVFNAAAQDTEFWFVAPDVAHTHSDSPVFFVFSNPDLQNDANVKIEMYAGWDTILVVPRGSYYKLDFERGHPTRPLSYVENPNKFAGTKSNYGIHIQSLNNVKILAYYMVNATSQRDIYSLKGKPALGKHFITTFQEFDGTQFVQRSSTAYNMGADQIDIVATEASTRIDINLTKNCIIGTTSNLLEVSNNPHTFYLDKGETLKLREDTIGVTNTDNDIATKKNTGTFAGTVITSSAPIAVTTSEDCISQAQSGYNGSTDLAGDQIVPVDMVGKRYVVIRGESTIGERIDFTATKSSTTINVHYFNGATPSSVPITLTNALDTKHIDISTLPGNPTGVFIDANEPVYCYQHSAVGGELGGAIIPSMYSISQQQIDYYQSNGDNYLFLVFRKDCDTTFTIEGSGIPEAKLETVVTSFLSSVQEIPSGHADEWRYAKIQIPPTYNEKMVTIRNSESTFSLGYFNGVGTSTASYGYLSGFGSFEFDPDTIWRCADNPHPVTFTGGYAKSYTWTLPDGSTKTTPSIKAYQAGKYVLEMDQDPIIVTDSVWIIDMQFNAEITREPNKPAKIGVPQEFRAAPKGTNLPDLNYQWTFQGGNPAISTSPAPTVIWNTTGQKTVTLKLSAKGGSGVNEVACDTTIVMDLQVRAKNNGYFVDQNVNGGLRDGSSWQNAFVTVQEALNMTSQGDYIWVAKGEYSPLTDNTYLIDYDSVQIYGGFGAWEANLNERDFAANPTILTGRNNSVVTFDGGTRYTNGFCGLSSTGVVLDGFIIQGGRAANGAGILFREGASATISNCIIRNNNATQNGGGMYLMAPSALCGHGSPVFFNLEVSGNTAVQGAGIYNNGSDFTATNITVSGNKATSIGGLYSNAGNPGIRNSIIWDNRDNSGTEGAMDITAAAGTPVYTYSILGGSNGSGTAWNVAIGTDAGKNTDVSPLFRTSGFEDSGSMRQGNYQLTGTSKAVNSGRNALVLSGNRLLKSISLSIPTDTVYTNTIANDLAGSNRIEYDIVDRGAYEYYKNSNETGTLHEVYIPEIENVSTDPESGLFWAKGHGSFILTLYPAEGYSLKDVEITTGSKIQDEQGGMQVVYNEDGSVTVTFRGVSEPLNIQFKGGVNPVSNEMIDSSYAIWTGNDQLYVRTTKAGTLKVYTLTGAMLKQQVVSEGEISIPLSQGVYIVTFNDGHQQKVVVK